MKNHSKKSDKGFTLIELLIVVAIIAILAAIAVPNFLEAQTRAKVSRAQADMRTFATCIESYLVDNNKYPPFLIPASADTNCTSNGGGGSQFLGTSVLGVRRPDGSPQCSVSSRLIWITTPIAYCSSLLPEAFSVKGATLTGVGGADPLEYDTYDFLSAASFAPGGNLGGNRGASLTSGAQWRLASAGPDNIQAFGGRQTAFGATDPSNQQGADYDSTNGTISSGDIIRVGGGRGPLPGATSNLLPFYYRVGNNLSSINNDPPIDP